MWVEVASAPVETQWTFSWQTILLSLKYDEMSWDFARPSNDRSEDCLPCLFLQFAVVENGRRYSKVLQVFSKQVSPVLFLRLKGGWKCVCFDVKGQKLLIVWTFKINRRTFLSFLFFYCSMALPEFNIHLKKGQILFWAGTKYPLNSTKSTVCRTFICNLLLNHICDRLWWWMPSWMPLWMTWNAGQRSTQMTLKVICWTMLRRSMVRRGQF